MTATRVELIHPFGEKLKNPEIKKDGWLFVEDKNEKFWFIEIKKNSAGVYAYVFSKSNKPDNYREIISDRHRFSNYMVGIKAGDEIKSLKGSVYKFIKGKPRGRNFLNNKKKK